MSYKWISVDKRVPKLDEGWYAPVIVLNTWGEVDVVVRFGEGKDEDAEWFTNVQLKTKITNITHWSPPPEHKKEHTK